MRKLRPSVGTFPRGFTVNTFIAAFFSTSPPLRHRVASQASFFSLNSPSCHCSTRQNNKLTHKLRMCFFLYLTHCYTALSSQLPHILRNCILSLNFRLEVRWHLNCTERKSPPATQALWHRLHLSCQELFHFRNQTVGSHSRRAASGWNRK